MRKELRKVCTKTYVSGVYCPPTQVCDRSARCRLRGRLYSAFGGRPSAVPLVLTNLSPRQDRGARSKLWGGRRLRLTVPVETNCSVVGVHTTPTLRLLLLTY